MPLSEPSIPWRTPSVQLLVDGRPVAGVIQAEVIANNHYAADSFRSILALGADPNATAAFWAGTGSVLVDLRFSLDQSGYVSLIQGEIDSIAIDPASGTVELDGRDLTARLIEARTQETFSNRTASEIATLLAQRHGLTPVVTATSTPVGRYYQNEHDRITLDQFGHATTEWELLVFLARQEGYDLFVQGTSLYFQPPGGTVAPAFVLQPDALIGLRLHRSLTLAKDIEVTVKSWNSRQKNAFTQINTPTRIFEYLALGKPVVAPDTQGIIDYFGPEELFYFTPGDAESMAEAIYTVANDRQSAIARAERGQLVYLRHTWLKEKRTFLHSVSELLSNEPAHP